MGTSPLTLVPTTGYGNELEEPRGRKGEWDALFEPISKVNVIKTCCSLCSANQIQVESCILLRVIDYLRFFMLVEFFPLLLGKKPTFMWI